jgi:uncharacterized protein (TIRG00374 family)
MFAVEPKFGRWVTLLAFFGFAGFLLYLYFFTGFTNVAVAIGNTNLLIYGLAFLCVIGGAAFNAMTWRSILGNLSVRTSFRRVFNLSWVGTFIDAIIPGGWSGDVFKTYILAKDPDVDGAKAAAAIVIKNVLELLVTLGALVTGMTLLAANFSLDSTVTIAIGVAMVLLALPLIVVIYLSTHLDATKRLLNWAKGIYARLKGRPVDKSFDEGRIQKSLNEFHEGIMTMKKNPKSMIDPILLQILAWTFDILALFIVFAALGSIVTPDKIIIANTIVVNLQSQGVALAGFTQIVSSTVYTVLGITPIIAMASTLLAGFAVFWFRILISFFAFQVTILDRGIPFLIRKYSNLNEGKYDGLKTPSVTRETEIEPPMEMDNENFPNPSMLVSNNSQLFATSDVVTTTNCERRAPSNTDLENCDLDKVTS